MAVMAGVMTLDPTAAAVVPFLPPSMPTPPRSPRRSMPLLLARPPTRDHDGMRDSRHEEEDNDV